MSQVNAYDVALILPLWLQPSGALANARNTDQNPPSLWLEKYANWIHENSEPKDQPKDKKVWQRVTDVYPVDHGRRIPGEWWERYSGFLYFHPFIQDLLFGKRGAIQTLTRADVQFARVQLRNHTGEILLAVREIRLFLFPSDLAILVVEAQRTSTREVPPLSLSTALDLTQQLRRTYPPYWQATVGDDGEITLQPGDCPTRVAWEDGSHVKLGVSDFDMPEVFNGTVESSRLPPMASHWRHLLDPLEPLPPVIDHTSAGQPPAVGATGPPDSLCWRPIEDDRAGSMVCLALQCPEAVSPEEMTRLAMVDAAGKWSGDAPYSTAFPPIRDFDANYCYDRFWDLDAHPPKTTRYLTSGYGFTVLGSSGDWFFTNVLREHFRRHYLLMGVLAHMQRASLLIFWERLADIVHAYSREEAGQRSRDDFASRAKWLVEDLADWVSRFYFSEVSNQIQGQELFNLWSQRLGTQSLYQQVMEQSRFVREVQAIHRQERIADEQHKLSLDQAELNIIANRWLPLSVGLSMASALVALATSSALADTAIQKFCYFLNPAACAGCQTLLTPWFPPATFLVAAPVTVLLWWRLRRTLRRVRK